MAVSNKKYNLVFGDQQLNSSEQAMKKPDNGISEVSNSISNSKVFTHELTNNKLHVPITNHKSNDSTINTDGVSHFYK